jgi:hypothetical protein
MEKDCVAMLKRMYGGDNGSIKQDLMAYEDLLRNFSNVRRNVRKCLRLWTITPGIFWIDNIIYA